MSGFYFERLSAQDSSFLVFEGPNTHMHVAGTSIYEAGPLAAPAGGIDISRIRSYIESRLHLIPRYRQRLAWIPVTGQPVWVDDDCFNLDYHVRHTSLPRPGDEAQLKQLSSRIMSQPLDRSRPLWETYIVEGLEGGRFAVITKTHHCMIDGASGVDLLTVLLQPEPDERIPDAPAWIPRPAPSGLDLVCDEGCRRAGLPLALAGKAREFLREPEKAQTRAADAVVALWDTLKSGLRRADDTPLNAEIGPHRRFDWLELDLEAVKSVKNRTGGTVNDVVLCTVAGAVGRFFERRRVNTDLLAFRAVVPVNVRSPKESGQLGNRVSAWIAGLPIHERDPLRRLARVRETTAELKRCKQALGARMLTQLAEWLGPTALSLGVRLADRAAPYNLIVTNVPGPQFPFYMLGAKMLSAYPLVPLFRNQALGVALFSYLGKIFWGFNADWDLMPDLDDFVAAVRTSFEELQEAATPRRKLAGDALQRTAAPARPRARRAASRG